MSPTEAFGEHFKYSRYLKSLSYWPTALRKALPG